MAFFFGRAWRTPRLFGSCLGTAADRCRVGTSGVRRRRESHVQSGASADAARRVQQSQARPHCRNACEWTSHRGGRQRALRARRREVHVDDDLVRSEEQGASPGAKLAQSSRTCMCCGAKCAPSATVRPVAASAPAHGWKRPEDVPSACACPLRTVTENPAFQGFFRCFASLENPECMSRRARIGRRSCGTGRRCRTPREKKFGRTC